MGTRKPTTSAVEIEHVKNLPPLQVVMPRWGYIEHVKAWFSLTRTEIFDLVQAGKIVSEKSGKRRRFNMASVDAYLTEQARQGGGWGL